MKFLNLLLHIKDRFSRKPTSSNPEEDSDNDTQTTEDFLECSTESLMQFYQEELDEKEIKNNNTVATQIKDYLNFSLGGGGLTNDTNSIRLCVDDSRISEIIKSTPKEMFSIEDDISSNDISINVPRDSKISNENICSTPREQESTVTSFSTPFNQSMDNIFCSTPRDLDVNNETEAAPEKFKRFLHQKNEEIEKLGISIDENGYIKEEEPTSFPDYTIWEIDISLWTRLDLLF